MTAQRQCRTLCKSDGCTRPVHAKGLCGACYMAALRARLRDSGLTCIIDGCGKPVYNLEHVLCAACNHRRLAYGDPTSHGKRPDLGKLLAQRFWEKVSKDGPVPALAPDLGPCWVWTAATPNGYGQFIVMRGKRGCPVGAHRMAWELLRGPVPEGLTLDHLCRNRACVNPDHLEPVTNEENIRRGMWPSAVNARKTHCVNGHEFTPENTYTRPDNGGRVCRICLYARSERYRKARRAARRAAAA